MQKKKHIAYEPCVACDHYAENEVCYHHVSSRGAHGDTGYYDSPANKMPLCFKCHTRIHFSIVKEFQNNKKVYDWLFEHERFDILMKENKHLPYK